MTNEALKSVYLKLRECAFNYECGLPPELYPEWEELKVLQWAIQDFAKRRGINLNE